MGNNFIKRLKQKPGTLIGVAVLTLIVYALTFSNAWADADGRVRTCREFVGTYLITNFEEDRSIDSRSLITFWKDGNFTFIDSNQGGVSGVFNPFTEAAGSWTCSRYDKREKVATMVTLDFTLPGTVDAKQQIARLDFFDVTVNRTTGKITGSAKLRFFPFESNPLGPPGVIEDPFFFEGERVKAVATRNSGSKH
ncbi:MAG: hypothetical protein JSU59_02310 [Nitrospirota bacterium]|nr:MAG: hypothetical protein JSU59_02310 [Nitrospirota bacterium]